MNLAADLAARWTPSPDQIAAAERYLASNPETDGVWTIHALVGKEQWVWTADVEIAHDGGVIFAGRDAAYQRARRFAGRLAGLSGKPVQPAYAYHTRCERWAVWEV